MAATANGKRGIISGINVTPLVDITLVLLIIFIVTAKTMVTPAVPLDLPTASDGQDVLVVFSLILPADGRVLINGEPIAEVGALEQKARAALAANPELRAVIQADGAVPHRNVISVLDSLRSAGVNRVAFGALPGSPPARGMP